MVNRRLPMETKIDDKGLFYLDINEYPLHQYTFSSSTKLRNQSKEETKFYEIPSTGDYLIKIKDDNKKKNELAQMIYLLQEKQRIFPNIEFPIGYVTDKERIIGQIIPNYPNSMTLKDIAKNSDLFGLQKYFYQDEDSIHNLFLLYENILNQIEEMFEEDVLYTDVHAGNFVIMNNQAKIIDFDNEYIIFSKMSYFQMILIRNYISMINKVNEWFNLYENFDYSLHECNLKKIKENIKRLENRVRRKR